MIIRQAAKEDVRQIAEILVEDWQIAYKGIIDSSYLDSMNVDQRYEIEVKRFDQYMVAAEGDEILGYAWNVMADEEDSDCEIIALYVRYSKRKGGIGRALMENAMDSFRAEGRKTMIIWCLEGNKESRKFYEKMGGKLHKSGTHRWGDREYSMISYLYQL
ncbi:MAG: GNAT family N-acetyltransferase [Clostridiales bacterium]|nr:GNAT family N-acetyltransferase [Clostridiales bacterium]